MEGEGTNQQLHNYEKQKVATSKAYNVCFKYFFAIMWLLWENMLNWFGF